MYDNSTNAVDNNLAAASSTRTEMGFIDMQSLGIFKIGECIEIMGITFQVHAIRWPRKLILKMVNNTK